MDYQGKLYGKVGTKKYVPLKMTSEEVEWLQHENARLKNTSSLAVVAQDLIGIHLSDHESPLNSFAKFYDVMRKHGIKQGIKDENGSITIANPDWYMCEVFFASLLGDHIAKMRVLNKIPEDLEL